jgi:hypothetical protein
MLRSRVIDSIIGVQGRQAIANLRTAWKRVENGASVGVLGIAPSPYRRVIPILQPFVIVLDLFTVIDFHDWFLRSLRDGGRIVRDGKKRVTGGQKNGNPEDGRKLRPRIGIRMSVEWSVQGLASVFVDAPRSFVEHYISR